MPKSKKGVRTENYYAEFGKKHGFGRMVAKMKRDGVFHHHFRNGLGLREWLSVLFAVSPGSKIYEWAGKHMVTKLRKTIDDEEDKKKKFRLR
jgi:hypothetical protein